MKKTLTSYNVNILTQCWFDAKTASIMMKPILMAFAAGTNGLYQLTGSAQTENERTIRMKLTKTLILLLMLIAATVFVMQVCRWRGAWVGVSCYWAVLTVKNFVDWRKAGKDER